MKAKLLYILLLLGTSLFAQVPQGFNYQATVRDNNGNLIVTQNVYFKFNIMQGSQTSLPIFSETHYVPTDDLGQVALVIGQGTATTGTFSQIDWSMGSYYLGIELNTGNGYVAMGTTQLLSVPYALYAANSGNTYVTPNLSDVLASGNGANAIISNVSNPINNQDAATKYYVDSVAIELSSQYQLLNISNDTIYLTNGGFVVLPASFSGDYNQLTNTPTIPTNVSELTNDIGYLSSELDSSITNELQALSISGDTIFLSNGGFVKLPDSFSGDYNDLTNLPSIPDSLSQLVNDAGYVTTDNDNQQLSVSSTGDTLYLSNGNWVIIPGISAANIQQNSNTLYTQGNGVTFDGYTYSSIIINGQEWMSENLRTTIYANGDVIPNISGGFSSSGGWSWYNNNSSFENPYGKLYNWNAVTDSRNVCPTGWHVPTDNEWNILTVFLGGDTIGSKLKSITGWDLNGNGTNLSGFNGFPGGGFSGGGFGDMTGRGLWWSSSSLPGGSSNAWVRILFYNNVNFQRSGEYKENGLSIRCLKNQ